MYCYVSYKPAIGYGVNILSKLSSTTSDYHQSCLKNLSIYLCINREWGISYKRTGPRLDIPELKCHQIVWDEKISKPNQDIDKGEIMCFVDAAYIN